jgi:adenosylhomocysteine nucleosidase
MDVRGLLDLKLGETPFDNISEIINSEEGYSCGSGDSFVSKKIEIGCRSS